MIDAPIGFDDGRSDLVESIFSRYQPAAVLAYLAGVPSGTGHDQVRITRVRDETELMVSISGTDDRQDWFAEDTGNLQIQQTRISTPAGISAYVHSGFWNSAVSIGKAIKEQIADWMYAPGHTVAFVGHSRGGAIAQLMPAAMLLPEHRCKVVTFGSAMVFAERSRRLPVHEVWNFRHWADLVPLTPVVPKLVGRYTPIGVVSELRPNGTVHTIPAQLPTTVQRILRDIRLYLYHRSCGRKAMLRFLAGQTTIKEIGGSVLRAHGIDTGYSIEAWVK